MLGFAWCLPPREKFAPGGVMAVTGQWLGDSRRLSRLGYLSCWYTLPDGLPGAKILSIVEFLYIKTKNVEKMDKFLPVYSWLICC
jgi:hypothetical protein